MRYVAGFLADKEGNVLLVEKKKPDWQKGKLNGIGGKIEGDEKPADAMAREWLEETGEVRGKWRLFCHLVEASEEGAEVFFYAAVTERPLRYLFPGNFVNDVGEKVLIIPRIAIPLAKTIDNLRWLIPMAFDDSAQPEATVTY